MLNHYQNINSYDRLLSGNSVNELNRALSSDPSILTRKDSKGSTLLHALSIRGFQNISYSSNLTIDAINLLTKAPNGAVNAQDANGLTPFHHQVLMALPNADEDDQRALKNTHKRQLIFPIFVNFALANGYDFSLADSKHGFTVFHLLAREKPLEAAKLLKAILENAAFNDKTSLNAVSQKGQTPLTLAILEGSLTTAGILLDNGASPTVPENDAMALLNDFDILPAMNNEDSSGAALKGCTELVPAAGAPRGSAHFTG